MNLKSVSTLNGSANGVTAIANMLSASPLLNVLDAKGAFELDAQNFDFLPVTSTGSIQKRAVGGSYTGTDIVPASKVAGALAIYGGRIDIDRTHIRDAEKGLRDIPSWFQKAIKKEHIIFAKNLEDKLMNGLGTSNDVKGISKILTGNDLPGYTGANRVINANDYSKITNSKSFDITLALSDTDKPKQRETFIEMLIYATSMMDGVPVMLLNSTMLGRMTTIAKKEHILGEDRASFGIPVSTFNGIPMIRLNEGSITNTEDDDTATTPLTNTTSLYLASFGEFNFSLVTNSGLDYTESKWMQTKEADSEKWEMSVAWKIEEPKSALRIRNIKA